MAAYCFLFYYRIVRLTLFRMYLCSKGLVQIYSIEVMVDGDSHLNTENMRSNRILLPDALLPAVPYSKLTMIKAQYLDQRAEDKAPKHNSFYQKVGCHRKEM